MRPLQEQEEQELSGELSARLARLDTRVVQFEWSVELGQRAQIPVRLIGVRVPPEVEAQRRATLQSKGKRKRQVPTRERLAQCGWNLYLTNAPAQKLPTEAVPTLYRVRWQVERLFRLWKEELRVDRWRTQQVERIECEVYAKLIGALLTQQLSAWAAWCDSARSLVKLAHTVRGFAWSLLHSLSHPPRFALVLRAFERATQTGCQLERRRTKPATFQRLQLALEALA